MNRYFSKKNSRQHRLKTAQVEANELDEYIYTITMLAGTNEAADLLIDVPKDSVDMLLDTTTRMMAVD